MDSTLRTACSLFRAYDAHVDGHVIAPSRVGHGARGAFFWLC